MQHKEEAGKEHGADEEEKIKSTHSRVLKDYLVIRCCVRRMTLVLLETRHMKIYMMSVELVWEHLCSH